MALDACTCTLHEHLILFSLQPLLLNSCREAATIDHDGVGFLNQFNQIFVGSEGIPSFSAKVN